MFERRHIEDNKAFKQLAVNDINRIISDATTKNQYDLSNSLRDLLAKIDQTPITASKELPFFYVAIRRYCMDITQDLNSNNYHTAMIRMREFESVVKELAMIADQNKLSLSSRENKTIARVEGRLEKFAKKSKIKIKKDYSPTQISIDTLYPAETIAELRLAGLQDRLDKAKEEMEVLRKSGLSQQISAQKQLKKQEIEMINNLIAISNKTMFREHQVELIKSASEEIKTEYAYQTKKFNQEQQEILDEWNEIQKKYGINADSEESLAAAAQNDLEEKVYELAQEIEQIDADLKINQKETSKILLKVQDLSEDLKTATGTERDMIAGQIRDLKIQYSRLAQKKKLLDQQKLNCQSAYQVLERDNDLKEIQERSGLNPELIAALKGVALDYQQAIEQRNEQHRELNDISNLVTTTDIDTNTDLDTDYSGEGNIDDIADFIALAEQER